MKSITNKKVVYTCITAYYDELYNHTYSSPDWDYVCFTDDLSISNENNKHWQLKPLQYIKLNHTKNQRWHKLHPYELFPDYEYSLWMDSNIDILSPSFFKDVYGAIESDERISIAPHPDRDCIYDEMQACLDHKKDTLENMQLQIDLFKKDKFPTHFGLFETNILLRKHNDLAVKKIMEDWWWWIENHSKRDQLSLTYVLWKNKFNADPLSKISYHNDDGRVKFWPHRTELRPHFLHLENIIESQTQQIESQTQQIESQTKEIEIRDKIDITQMQIIQIEKDLNKIKSTKFFQLWQSFNIIKRKIR